MEQVLGGLQILMTWQNFLVIPIGLIIGIVVGAIPGLTSDLGIILCIPLTYGMDPTMAILMLLAIYCGGTYGGSITAVSYTHLDVYKRQSWFLLYSACGEESKHNMLITPWKMWRTGTRRTPEEEIRRHRFSTGAGTCCPAGGPSWPDRGRWAGICRK